MRQAKIIFFIFSFLLITNSQLSAKEPYGVTPELRCIETADARKDFHEAIKKGEEYFLGIYGFALTVPGLPSIADNCHYDFIIPVRPVKGTTDAIENDEQDRLIDIAQRYATKFNELMYLKLESENRKICPKQ